MKCHRDEDKRVYKELLSGCVSSSCALSFHLISFTGKPFEPIAPEKQLTGSHFSDCVCVCVCVCVSHCGWADAEISCRLINLLLFSVFLGCIELSALNSVWMFVDTMPPIGLNVLLSYYKRFHHATVYVGSIFELYIEILPSEINTHFGRTQFVFWKYTLCSVLTFRSKTFKSFLDT